MQANPNQTFEDLKPKTWVFSGDFAVFHIPSVDAEIVHGIEHLIRDLLNTPKEFDNSEGYQPVVVDHEGVTIFGATNHYTRSADDFNAALANAAEHYGLGGIVWVSGTRRVAKALAQGVPA